MRKLSAFTIMTAVIVLASCSGNNTGDNTSNAGKKMDSMVNSARAAIRKTTDSIARGTRNATDSLKAAADSLKSQ